MCCIQRAWLKGWLPYTAVSWVAAVGSKVLVCVCWFDKQVRVEAFTFEWQTGVEERDTVVRPLCSEFDGGVGLVQILRERLQAGFTMATDGKNDKQYDILDRMQEVPQAVCERDAETTPQMDAINNCSEVSYISISTNLCWYTLIVMTLIYLHFVKP